MAKPEEPYSQQEAQKRFEAALKGAMNTPHKPNEELKLGKSTAKRSGRSDRPARRKRRAVSTP